MWNEDFSKLSDAFVKVVDCRIHRHQIIEDLKDKVWKAEKSKLVWHVRLRCMKPLLFEENFSDQAPQLRSWAREGMLLPDIRQNVIPDGRADAVVKDIVKLADSVVYHLSLMLQSLAILSEHCEFGKKLFRQYLKHCREASNYCTLDGAVNFIRNDEFYQIICECIDIYSESRKKMVTAAFLITCEIFHLSYSNIPYGTLEEEFEIISWGNEALELKNKGNEEYRDNQFSQAVASYTKTIKMSRYNRILYSNRAMAYLKLHKWNEAELDSRRVVILKPDWCKGYYRLAQALEGQTEYHLAHSVCFFGMKQSNNTDLLGLEKQLIRLCLQNNGPCNNKKINNGRYNREFAQFVKEKDKTKHDDVPELVPDSSDSDEETFNRNQFTRNEKNRRNIVSSMSFKQSVKAGSEAFLQGCVRSAISYYQEALSTVSKVFSIEDFNLKEIDIVVLKYASGMANMEYGQMEEIQKAISLFEDIIENHENISFPAAYYSLGLAYFKMNRFKEALTPLFSGRDILEKSIVCCSNQWPGKLVTMEETKPGKLKKSIEELILQCRYPPRPNAVCRSDECNFNKSIYYCDIDFHGFARLKCSEQCFLEYHPRCWKQFKDKMKSKNEKEFLHSSCTTPDCNGIIIIIEIIDKDGKISKEFRDKIHENQTEQSKHRKTKLEKKMEQKEKKKRHSQDNNNLTEKISFKYKEPVEEDETDKEQVEHHLPPKYLENSASVPQNEEGNGNCVDKNRTDSSSPKRTGFPAEEEPLYVLKREKDDDSKKVEVKEPKPKKQKKKTVLSLEEFCGDTPNSLFNEYQRRLEHLRSIKRMVEKDCDYWPNFCAKQVKRIPQLDPEKPFFIPQDLQNNYEALEAVLISYDGIGESDTVMHRKEAIYSYMEHFLKSSGPKLIDDPLLLEEILSFPAEDQNLINESGGITKFLLKSMKFVQVGDYLYALSDTRKPSKLTGQSNQLDVDTLESSKNKNHLYRNSCDEVINYDDDNNLEISNLHHTDGSKINHDDENKQSETRGHDGSGDMQCDLDGIAKLFSMLQEIGGHPKPNLKVTVIDQLANRKVDLMEKEKSSDKTFEVALPSEISSCTDPEPVVPAKVCSTGVGQECNLYVKNQEKCGVDINSFVEQLKQTIIGMPVQNQVDLLTCVINAVLSAGFVKSADFCSMNRNIKGVRISPKVKLFHKSSQASDGNVEKVSIGIMKRDEELEELQELVSSLEQDKKKTEDRLVDALDKVIQLQKKFAVETDKLKKEVEEAKEYAKIIKEEWHNGLQMMEIEKKKWQQDHQKWSENLKQAQKETVSARAEKEKAEMERNELLQDVAKISKEIENEKKSSFHLQDTIQTIIDEYEDTLNNMKNAERSLIEFKIAEVNRQMKKAKSVALKILDELKAAGANNPLIASPSSLAVKQVEHYILVLKQSEASFRQMADEQLEGLSAGKHVKDFPELNLPDIPDLPVLQVLQGTTMTEASTVKSGLSVKGTASPPQELSDFVKPIMVPTQAGALKSENLAKNIVVQNGKSPLKAKKESMRDLDPIELPKGNHLQTHVRTRSTSRELKTEMYINSQLAAPQPTDSKSKKPYDKLLEKLNTKYPQISQTDLTTYIKTFRAQKKGLTGMSLDTIVACVSSEIEKSFQEHSMKLRPSRVPAMLKPISASKPPRPSGLDQPTVAWAYPKIQQTRWAGKNPEDNTCAICLEDIVPQSIKKVNCGHAFHTKCIQDWLVKQSTCPSCRIYVVLEEEFPSLK